MLLVFRDMAFGRFIILGSWWKFTGDTKHYAGNGSADVRKHTSLIFPGLNFFPLKTEYNKYILIIVKLK